MSAAGDSESLLRSFEEFAKKVEQLLRTPIRERTRDAIQLTEPADLGIIVLLTPDAIELRLPTIVWQIHPIPSSRLWKRIEFPVAISEVALAISAAREARSTQFHRCRFCGDLYPPERRHSDDVCHGCAENHLGVVH
jgi:hypothetical protein